MHRVLPAAICLSTGPTSVLPEGIDADAGERMSLSVGDQAGDAAAGGELGIDAGGVCCVRHGDEGRVAVVGYSLVVLTDHI